VRAVVGQVGRVAAVGQGAPGVGAARATRAVPRTVLADRAEARARVVRTGVAPLGEPAVTGEDRLFLRVLDREGRAAAVAGLADGERVLLGLAVAFAELADVRGGFSAFEALAGDHVDHAGDRVGTVDGRGAVLKDFHPVDGRHRDLAEILV